MELIKCFLLILTGICHAEETGHHSPKKPNVIFILADDLGFNDVPWHNPEVVAPNLKWLAEGGVILEQSYVQPICSPTRSALLSGTYPFATGRQRGVIWPMMPTGLTLKTKIIPEFLKPLGYSTHAIGKWHIGFCKWSYTPTERGFDTFRGYYTGSEDYYTKMRSHFTKQESFGEEFYEKDAKPAARGYDYRNNRDVYFNASNEYSTYDYADHFESVIKSKNASSPLFIYMAFQSVHSPLEVPSKYTKPYAHIKNKNRRTYLGMVSAMDEAIGRMVKSLVDSGLYNDSVIIFSTDNGGPTITGGNNWPLRGNKTTLWEGGTRGAAFVHSPLLPNKGIKSNQLFHTTDWLATIVSLAGGKAPSTIDGIDQWQTLVGNARPPRKEVVYNLDQIDNKRINGGIRYGHYKLLVGNPGPGDWTPPPEESSQDDITSKKESIFKERINNILSSKLKKMIYKSFRKCKEDERCLNLLQRWLRRRLKRMEKKKPTSRKMTRLVFRLKEKFKSNPNKITSKSNRMKRSEPVFVDEMANVTSADYRLDLVDYLISGKVKLGLYDLKYDPEERHNLCSTMKTTVRVLLKRLVSHMGRYVPPDNPPNDNKGNPKFWNGVWSPGWC